MAKNMDGKKWQKNGWQKIWMAKNGKKWMTKNMDGKKWQKNGWQKIPEYESSPAKNT